MLSLPFLSSRGSEHHPSLPHSIHEGAAGALGERVHAGKLRLQAEEVRTGFCAQPARIDHQGKCIPFLIPNYYYFQF